MKSAQNEVILVTGATDGRYFDVRREARDDAQGRWAQSRAARIARAGFLDRIAP